MGREREILRWEAHDTLLGDAIARAEDELASLPPEDARTSSEGEQARALAGQIEDLRRRRRELGPSPRAKMG